MSLNSTLVLLNWYAVRVIADTFAKNVNFMNRNGSDFLAVLNLHEMSHYWRVALSADSCCVSCWVVKHQNC